MCNRVMGSGEYAERAKVRISAENYSQLYKLKTRDRVRSSLILARAKQSNTLDRHNNLDIAPSIRFFHTFGIGLPALENATKSSRLTGRNPAEELIRSGIVSRVTYARFCAQHLGVEYSASGPKPSLLTNFHKKTSNLESGPAKPSADFTNVTTEYRGWREKPKIYVACEPEGYKAISALVENPAIDKSQIALATASVLHNAQFCSQKETHLDNAINGLSNFQPDKSAAKVITARQGFVIATASAVLGMLFYFQPGPLILFLHLLASAFYLAVTFMRAALIMPGSKTLKAEFPTVCISPDFDRALPVYTVLVALYEEQGQVDQLADALSRLDWPADRLQILLVCEEGDKETIARCRLHCDDPRFQTIVCPKSHPQTKPKALNYALPLARGEFLVLYDAEDIPHPQQLREAHAKFLTDDNLACLQAPLFIHNETQSWFTRMFSIEYTTQFALILPVLEKWRAPIPLGGTSNHFRTSVLNKIGAWDPFNVTEDADLGIRLARHGYHCGTLKRPTMEEAPPVLDVWFKQRSRWIKGWLQTFLVHTRYHRALATDLGWRKMIFFHLVITAIVVSVLIHPFFIISTILSVIAITGSTGFDPFTIVILSIDILNLVSGYSTYFIIAWLTLDQTNRRHLKPSIFWLPVYWLLISMAGWKAFAQLLYNPFYWEKTPHGLSKSRKE